MTNADIIQKLIEARPKLARGWCQNVAHRGFDQTCLFASLWGADHYGDTEVILALARAIKPISVSEEFRMMMGEASTLVIWNDVPGRTQEQVLDLVDRTIASLMKVEAAEVVEREELVDA